MSFPEFFSRILIDIGSFHGMACHKDWKGVSGKWVCGYSQLRRPRGKQTGTGEISYYLSLGWFLTSLVPPLTSYGGTCPFPPCQLRVELLPFSLGCMGIRWLHKSRGRSPWLSLRGLHSLGSTECRQRQWLVWSLLLDKGLFQWSQGFWVLRLLGLQTATLLVVLPAHPASLEQWPKAF